MAIPGVGPVTALTVKAGIDDPSRFRKSKTVGAHFGLTPKREQSGTSVDRDGHISRCGDGEVRTALYEASSAMLTPYTVSFSRPNAAWRPSCRKVSASSLPKMSMRPAMTPVHPV